MPSKVARHHAGRNVCAATDAGADMNGYSLAAIEIANRVGLRCRPHGGQHDEHKDDTLSSLHAIHEFVPQDTSTRAPGTLLSIAQACQLQR